MSLSESQGDFAPFIVDGETHKTWYRVVGNLTSVSHRPLIVVHGGPGKRP
jgi:hypothetical protein